MLKFPALTFKRHDDTGDFYASLEYHRAVCTFQMPYKMIQRIDREAEMARWVRLQLSWMNHPPSIMSINQARAIGIILP